VGHLGEAEAEVVAEFGEVGEDLHDAAVVGLEEHLWRQHREQLAGGEVLPLVGQQYSGRTCSTRARASRTAARGDLIIGVGVFMPSRMPLSQRGIQQSSRKSQRVLDLKKGTRNFRGDVSAVKNGFGIGSW